jgi:hypothetical protein
MWEAISNRGMPIPYFRPSKLVAVNTEILYQRVVTATTLAIHTQTSQ